jgi:hypothetical protein
MLLRSTLSDANGFLVLFGHAAILMAPPKLVETPGGVDPREQRVVTATRSSSRVDVGRRVSVMSRYHEVGICN